MMDDDAAIPAFTIVPAQAGWYVAIFIPGQPGKEDSPPFFDLEPIIAWHIEHARYAAMARRPARDRCHHITPMTVGYPNANLIHNDWAIKRPDGKFEIMEDIAQDTEAEALAHMQHEHEERIKKEKPA
jgi:hypothetical protein